MTYKNRVEWLKCMNKPGIAIEIGVGCGDFSLEILKNTSFDLISVDCWEKNEFNNTPEISLKQTVQKLSPFIDRSIIIKSYSNNKLTDRFKDNSIDLIYIDGDHFYDGVKNDLEIWFPKIKKGGVFGGHDYSDYRGWGVKKAVSEFFQNKNINIIPAGHPGDGNQPSWFLEK